MNAVTRPKISLAERLLAASEVASRVARDADALSAATGGALGRHTAEAIDGLVVELRPFLAGPSRRREKTGNELSREAVAEARRVLAAIAFAFRGREDGASRELRALRARHSFRSVAIAENALALEGLAAFVRVHAATLEGLVDEGEPDALEARARGLRTAMAERSSQRLRQRRNLARRDRLLEELERHLRAVRSAGRLATAASASRGARGAPA